jgi:hypothetical protein
MESRTNTTRFRAYVHVSLTATQTPSNTTLPVAPTTYAMLPISVREFSCPVCCRWYRSDTWLARHISTEHPSYRPSPRAPSRSPPPAAVDHSGRAVPPFHRHAPVLDDILMPDVPAEDAASQDADSDDGPSRARVEGFPNAGAPVPRPADDGNDAPRGFDPARPWEPFDTEADFMLARFMIEYGVTETAMDHLLKTLLPSLGVHNAVRSVYTIKQRVDDMRDGLGHESWRLRTSELEWNDEHPGPIEYYSRDITQCARWLLRQPAYEDHLTYAPERHFNDAGERIYSEMHTADWWWDQQVGTPLHVWRIPR